jgi:uncharacterized protein
MEFLVWLIRVVIVLIIARVVSRLFLAPRRAAAGRPPVRGRERVGGTLVRDPQCGTYVPASRAIQVGHGSSALYFCSEACRSAYGAGHHA